MSNDDKKKIIAYMYYAMSKACEKQSGMIEENPEDYEIKDYKMGYETEFDNGEKWELICELKKVEEDD